MEARAGCRDGDVDVGSVEGLRPVGVPVAGGFLVAADISMDAVMLREWKFARNECWEVVHGRSEGWRNNSR